MVRTAIIGSGIRGSLFAQGLKQNPDATLVGICDTNNQSLNSAAAKWEVQGYTEIDTLLKGQNPDAVIICTPDFAHQEYVIAAANHGIHVMVEKPLAISEEAANQILKVVQKAGIICQLAFENRWNPPFVKIKQAVDNGELGDISLINTRLNDTLFVPAKMLSWADKSTVGWFLLPHLVDLAIWLSGKKPSKVYAVANKKVLPSIGINTYDTICTTLSFHDDMQAMFETSWVLPDSLPSIFDFKFEILGDKGLMHADVQDQMVHQSTQKHTYPGTLAYEANGKTHGFPLHMLDSFIECVKEGTKPQATVEEGYEVTRIIDAIHQSIIKGQTIDM